MKVGMVFTTKNEKFTTDLEGAIISIYIGFNGVLDYIHAENALDKLSSKIQNGAILLSVASRKEKPGHPGVKLTSAYNKVLEFNFNKRVYVR